MNIYKNYSLFFMSIMFLIHFWDIFLIWKEQRIKRFLTKKTRKFKQYFFNYEKTFLIYLTKLNHAKKNEWGIPSYYCQCYSCIVFFIIFSHYIYPYYLSYLRKLIRIWFKWVFFLTLKWRHHHLSRAQIV